MSTAKLRERAKRRGLGIEDRECSQCKGKGKLLHVDGLDLRRLREKAGMSKYRLAQLSGKGVSFISMVEETDPDKEQRRCPDDLLACYLDLSVRGGVDKQYKKRDSEAEQKVHAEGGNRLALWQAARRSALAEVKKGQIWERANPRAKGDPDSREVIRAEVAHVEDGTVVLRRWDNPQAAPWSVSHRTLVKQYKNVTEEVRG